MSHTAGPWRARRDIRSEAMQNKSGWNPDDPSHCDWAVYGFTRVACIPSPRAWCDEATTEANALLMAAAPELLAACKLANGELIALGVGSSASPALRAIWAAISMAEPVNHEPTNVRGLAPVKAEAHSDDYNVQVEFDAADWFEQASDQEIVELVNCGWGGDYPADAVAEFLSDADLGLSKLFDYLHAIANDPSKKDCNGFECHIDPDKAAAWLNANRPQLAQHLADRPEEPTDG